VIKFNILSIVTSIIAGLLFICLLLFPEFIFMLFEINGNESAYFISRRAAMLFLGYAIISYLARNAQPSMTRQALAFGLGVTMFSLAILGLIELLRGAAGIGILLAIGTELLIAGCYFLVWNSNRSD